MPKDFKKTTKVLPFTKYSLSSLEEFRKSEQQLDHLECMKEAGLTSDEVKLYQEENEAELIDQRKKIASGLIRSNLKEIYSKLNMHYEERCCGDLKEQEDKEPTSSKKPANLIERFQQKPKTFYPEGHPMNELNELESSLLGNLKTDMIPLTKRRKTLRRLERKKERSLAQAHQSNIASISTIPSTSKCARPGSLWDVKETPQRIIPHTITSQDQEANDGSEVRQQAMYSIIDNKIVKVSEPVLNNEEEPPEAQPADIPEIDAEAQLLEGTKMSLDDIRKINRFKDYEPGIPSKVLYLKNIAPTVSQEQLSLLFNQFVLANGGPVDLRLMTGRMRGQAFVALQNEELAIQALEEINGTILGGQPVIAEFGRNTNRIQDDHR